MTEMETLLRSGLAALGLPETGVEPLLRYAAALAEKNKVMNLTAITDPAEVATLHFLDSAALLGTADFRGKSVVDVGTGAGFPGLPLRILEPTIRLTLLDALQKRIGFLQEVCTDLGLADVACVHGRAEEFARDHREGFDLAVSRAVANLSVLCELCLPLVKVGGAFLAMKSTGCEAETDAAREAIRRLGGRLGRTADYTIPTTEIPHRVLVIEKIAPTPHKYPRPFAQIKKQPL